MLDVADQRGEPVDGPVQALGQVAEAALVTGPGAMGEVALGHRGDGAVDVGQEAVDRLADAVHLGGHAIEVLVRAGAQLQATAELALRGGGGGGVDIGQQGQVLGPVEPLDHRAHALAPGSVDRIDHQVHATVAEADVAGDGLGHVAQHPGLMGAVGVKDVEVHAHEIVGVEAGRPLSHRAGDAVEHRRQPGTDVGDAVLVIGDHQQHLGAVDGLL